MAYDVSHTDSIFREHAPRLQRFVASRVGNATLAEDITSETFARAIAAINRYRDDQGASIATWLHTIANNLIADHWKSARTRREVITPEPDAVTATLETPESIALAADETDRATACVASLIELLNPDQQRSIWLRYWHELPIKEIAAQLDRSPDAVKQLNRRAMRTMSQAAQAGTPDASAICRRGCCLPGS